MGNYDFVHYIHLPTAAELPTNLTAVQIGLSSLRVSWAPAAAVTGYDFYWTGGGVYGCGNMSAGAGDTAVNITGLNLGVTYNISLVALSDHLPSPIVKVMVTLGKSCV